MVQGLRPALFVPGGVERRQISTPRNRASPRTFAGTDGATHRRRIPRRRAAPNHLRMGFGLPTHQHFSSTSFGGDSTKSDAISSCLPLLFRRTPPGSRINRHEFLSGNSHGHSRHAAHHIDFTRIAGGSGRYAGIRMRDKLQYAVLDFAPGARVPRPDVQEIDRTRVLELASGLLPRSLLHAPAGRRSARMCRAAATVIIKVSKPYLQFSIMD